MSSVIKSLQALCAISVYHTRSSQPGTLLMLRSGSSPGHCALGVNKCHLFCGAPLTSLVTLSRGHPGQAPPLQAAFVSCPDCPYLSSKFLFDLVSSSAHSAFLVHGTASSACGVTGCVRQYILFCPGIWFEYGRRMQLKLWQTTRKCFWDRIFVLTTRSKPCLAADTSLGEWLGKEHVRQECVEELAR